MQQKIAQKLYSFSFLFTTLTLCLTPLLFLPALPWASSGLKFFVLIVGAFLAFIFWILSQFSEGEISFPKRRALGMLGLWQLLLVIGVFFSTNTKLSVWGRGVSADSLIVLISFSIIVFLLSQFASERKRGMSLFFSFFLTLSIIFVLQVLLSSLVFIPFIANAFSHVAITGTLLGSWTDFAYFVVFLYGVALMTYELYSPSKIVKKIAGALVILSLLVFLFLNISLVWLFVCVTTLCVFLYRMVYTGSPEEGIEKKNTAFPTVPFVGILISLFFLLSSPVVSSFFARSVGFTFNDIRPSFSASTSVLTQSTSSKPIFGNGMGTYQDLWDMYKPAEINQTPYWNTSFPSGFNFFMSAGVTQGLLPLVLFLVFVVSILVLVVRNSRVPAEDTYTKWIRGITTFGALLFIVILFFHTPSISLFAIGAWIIGVLIAVAPHKDVSHTHTIQYLKDPRKSFFALGGMLTALVLSFGIVFYAINLFIGSILYSVAVRASDEGQAIRRLTTVVQINQNDLYHRVRASLLFSQFNALAQSENNDVVLTQNLYREAVAAANQSVMWHDGLASNWLLLSQMYQVGASTENTELFQEAQRAGQEALRRNPHNPVLELNMAQVALTQESLDEAYGAIARAKTKKADYIDAYLLRGQILVSQGQEDGLVTELRAFLAQAPTNANGYALLAQAYVQRLQYDEALGSIVYAQQLDPTNLSYFGTYITILEQSNRRDVAIRELEAFKARFPNITGVDEKIEELRNIPAAQVLEPEITLEEDIEVTQ